MQKNTIKKSVQKKSVFQHCMTLETRKAETTRKQMTNGKRKQTSISA